MSPTNEFSCQSSVVSDCGMLFLVSVRTHVKGLHTCPCAHERNRETHIGDGLIKLRRGRAELSQCLVFTDSLICIFNSELSIHVNPH